LCFLPGSTSLQPQEHIQQWYRLELLLLLLLLLLLRFLLMSAASTACRVPCRHTACHRVKKQLKQPSVSDLLLLQHAEMLFDPGWLLAGSLAGGTLVTITGAGFPAAADISSGRATLAITTAAGSSCRVVSSDYSTIRCVTSPAPDEVLTQALIENGQLPMGNSGALAAAAAAAASGAPPGVGVVWPGGVMVGPRGWVYDVFTNDR
jgi:hypothetical protein